MRHTGRSFIGDPRGGLPAAHAPPPVFGYHIYTVLSGSMEPAIPVGSLSYIQETAPEDMKEKDVIAYYGGSDRTAIITHRVVEKDRKSVV